MTRWLAAVTTVCIFGCAPLSPSVLEFVEIAPAQPRIGDVVAIRVRLIDERGVPLAGVPVDFKVQTASPGVTVNPTGFSTKGTGIAESQLVATGGVKSVIVEVTAGDKHITTPPITFAGARPNARQFTFQCGPVAGASSGGRHAIMAYDESRSLIAGVKLPCVAHVGDRNGDGLSGVQVSFMAEAGTIGPTETSTANVVGDAEILYKTSLPLPLDVPPGRFSWSPPADAAVPTLLAPLWMIPWQWKPKPTTGGQGTGEEPRRVDPIRKKLDGQPYQNNPRDNLVTLIAVTAGEEAFDDRNNNGVFNSGDGFAPGDDLPEPFVDSNDSGKWEEGERFIDVDGDGRWSPPNGKWDGNILIWTSERILWTGLPAGEDMAATAGMSEPTVVTASPASITLPCQSVVTISPGLEGCVQAGPPVDVTAYVADPWYNAPAQNGDDDGCSIEALPESPVVATPTVFGVPGLALTYPAGRFLALTVRDARSGNITSAEVPVRHRPPGLSFVLPIRCQFTGSPNDGYKADIVVGSVRGNIE